MDKIIAVGGTGQDVLQLYLLAYLCGAVTKPFEALIVDADELRPGIETIKTFLDATILDPSTLTGFGAQIPQITYANARPNGTRVAEVLLGYQPETMQTAAHAFFDDENLMQTVDKGLFARPALSSVLSGDLVDERLLLPDRDGRVYVVGSVLGGTGGGMLARIIDAVADVGARHGIEPKIRAVVFGEYFEPTPGLIERSRMRSNQFMVLRSLAAGAAHLHSYAIIDAADGHLVQDRTPMNVDRLPIPAQQTDPIWKGVNALHWIRHDEVTAAAREFPDREKEPRTVLRVDEVRSRLVRASSACDTLVKQNLPGLVSDEPWASRVWGDRLVHFHRNVMRGFRSQSEDVSRSRPIEELRRAIDQLWRESSASRGLSGLMPEASERIRPEYFRSLAWPARAETIANLDAAATRVGANYLFHCMRETQA